MKKILLKLFLLLFVTNIFSQAPVIEWQKSFGGSGTEFSRNSLVTSDGGYILFGNSNSNDGDVTNNHGDSDLWIVKLNELGVMQWQKTYGGSNSEFAESIRETSDGYIVIGYTYSDDGDIVGFHGGGNADVWILKLNNSGVIEWQKTLGTSNYEAGKNIISTSDGGYLIIAEKSLTIVQGQTTYGTTQYWIIKIGSTGIVQWEKIYGGIGSSRPSDVLQTDEGGYMVLGETSAHDGDVIGNHGPAEREDIWLLNLTSTGDISWQKCYGGSLYERAFRIIKTSEGGYIIAGDSDSNDGDLAGTTYYNDYTDIWILKINNFGEIEWQRNYGGSDINYSFDIFETTDSGYVFCGYTRSNDGDVIGNHGECDAWIVKINTLGVIQWQKTLGGSLCDSAFNIKPTTDNGFFVSGYSSSNDGDCTQNLGLRDYWAVKLSAENLSNTAFEENKLMLFPNPANTQLNLKIKNNLTIDKVKITDISGKQVFVQTNSIQQIDIKHLTTGMYFIQVFSEGKKYQAKFIKE